MRGKRLGRCSATLMVGYLCCKSYYMCWLLVVCAIFATFYMCIDLAYHCCCYRVAFFSPTDFHQRFRRLSFDYFIEFPTTHNHSFGFSATAHRFWFDSKRYKNEINVLFAHSVRGGGSTQGHNGILHFIINSIEKEIPLWGHKFELFALYNTLCAQEVTNTKTCFLCSSF